MATFNVNNASAGAGGGGSLITRILIIVIILVAAYYIYRYFFTQDTMTFTQLVSGVADAKKPGKVIPADALPGLYEGGEYSMSCWVYINDWSYRRTQMKHIFEIGGSNFVTLLVGLGNYKNKLVVRLHTADQNSTTNPEGSVLTTTTRNTLLSDTGMENGLTSANGGCDLPSIDMQRWVLVSVVISGRICDVYIDGKLARSCTLPSFFKVDNGYAVKTLLNGGFGGFISNLTAYGYALNPADIYKTYMAGPTTSMGFIDWLKSFFEADYVGFPKMN